MDVSPFAKEKASHAQDPTSSPGQGTGSSFLTDKSTLLGPLSFDSKEALSRTRPDFESRTGKNGFVLFDRQVDFAWPSVLLQRGPLTHKTRLRVPDRERVRPF